MSSTINEDPNDLITKPSCKEKKHTVGTLKELLEEKDIMVNLFLMAIIWTSCAFSYYLAMFKVTFVAGNVFRNAVSQSMADAISRPTAYIAYKYSNTKKVMFLFFMISALGSIPVIFSQGTSEGFKKYIVPVCLWIGNFGSCANFSNLFIGHLDLFPLVFATTTMGICNVIARGLTVFAPLVAEVEEPYPEIIYTVLCFMAAITSFFIREKSKIYY